MRLHLPRRGENFPGLARFTGFGEPAGRPKPPPVPDRAELDRLSALASDVSRSMSFKGQCARRQQHRALAAVVGFVEPALHLLERQQRAGPVIWRRNDRRAPLGPAQASDGCSRTAPARRGARRSYRCGAAPRYKAAQAEQLGVGTRAHGAKRMLGGAAVAPRVAQTAPRAAEPEARRATAVPLRRRISATRMSPAPIAIRPRETAR